MVVERLVSLWEGLFSGAMLNFRRVPTATLLLSMSQTSQPPEKIAKNCSVLYKRIGFCGRTKQDHPCWIQLQKHDFRDSFPTATYATCSFPTSPLKLFELFLMLPPCSAPQTRSFPTWKLLNLHRISQAISGSWDPWLIFPQVASTFFMPLSISDIWLWSHVFKLVSVASCETQQGWRLSLQMAGNQAPSTMVTSSVIIMPSPCQRGIKI